MFPELRKQGNIDKKHNVSATMFSSLSSALFSSFTQERETPLKII